MLSYRSSTEQTQYTQTSSDQTTGSDSMDRWVLNLNRKVMDLIGFDSMDRSVIDLNWYYYYLENGLGGIN